jgi:hypothetical protein
MSDQELTFTIQLDDGSLAEARAVSPQAAKALRRAVETPSPKWLKVSAAEPADTSGHALENDALAVSITLEGDVEGHTMILRLPSAQEARELQKRLLITGVLAATIVAGAAGANLAQQQRVQAVPQAGPAITVSAPATRFTPASIDAQLRDSSVSTGTTTGPLSPAKDAKDARASEQSTGTDSSTDSSPAGPGSRTTYPQ